MRTAPAIRVPRPNPIIAIFGFGIFCLTFYRQSYGIIWAIKTMAKTIERVELSTEEKNELLNKSFSLSAYALEENVLLFVGGADIIKQKGFAYEMLVLNLYFPADWDKEKKAPKENANPHTVYLKSLCREIRDHRNDPIEIKGTLNDSVKELLGKSYADVLSFFEERKGKTVTSTLICYKGVNKKGDTYDARRNGYNWVE